VTRALTLALAALLALAGACNKAPTQDLSAEQLTFVVQSHQPALKNCYEVALSKNPYRQEMRMQAVLDITPEGRVKTVSLEGGGGLPGMNKCITAEIKSWQFPKAKDPTATSLPIIFQPEVKQPRGPDIEAFKKLMNETGGE
jgi:hypothetical protein